MFKFNLNLRLILLIANLPVALKASDFDLEFNLPKFDATVVGCTNLKEPFGQILVDFIKHFKDKLKLNFIGRTSLVDNFFSNNIKNIIEGHDKSAGNVAISFGLMHESLLYMPESLINISYSYFQSSRIPDEWVKLLNNHFDAVVVPAKFLVKAYKKSGVKIPIFVLPPKFHLDMTSGLKKQRTKNRSFIFYSTRMLCQGANHELLLNAFLNKFADNPDVLLEIYIKDTLGIKRLYEIINERKACNVDIIISDLNSQEYFESISSADCYVSVSKSECFLTHIIDALSLGLPCILSNNTIHKELLQNSYVQLLKSSIKEPADYRFSFGKYIGNQYNSLIGELEESLQNIYYNYEFYLKDKDKINRLLDKYNSEKLDKKYLNLIKPKKVIFGLENKIKKNYIMTNSKELYEKYLIISSLNI